MHRSFTRLSVDPITNEENVIIDLKNVSYWRIDKQILQKINWQVKKGENWVLFGPNGSGKTTLLKILTGYIFPSDGHGSVLNRTIGETDVFELRKQIGWVSSSLESLIHDEDPLLDIVLSGTTASTRLWETPTPEEEAKAKTLLKQFGLNGLENRLYEVLSQGERKKTLIARALITDPKILILDEPCEGLDIAAREHFLKDLELISKLPNAPTILLVTHHVEEILKIFTKILILKEGKIFNMGEIDRLLNSTLLSKLFGMKINIQTQDGRFIQTTFFS